MNATTGSKALNLAMGAGFEIVRHGRDTYRGLYVHVMEHADGRTLVINTAWGTGRLVGAQGQDRKRWNTRSLSARSVPAIGRMLAA